MKSLRVIQNNERGELCAPCGGKCCKAAPGAYWPQDFGDTEEVIKMVVRSKLLDGSVVLDEEHRPCVRPPIADYPDALIQIPRWFHENQCARLTQSGCSLSFDQRPRQCRGMAVTPQINGSDGCAPGPGLTDEACRRAWKPFRAMFAEVIAQESAP